MTRSAAISKPSMSFVIPAHNRAHLIAETIDSVLAQTNPNWEAIIVDDGSTDGTDAVVKAYSDPRLRYYKLPSRLGAGVSAARNYGNFLARAQLIAVLDSDDLATPDRLELALASYAEDHWDLYATSRKTLDMETRQMREPQNTPAAWDAELFKQASFMTHSTVVYTKAAVMEIPYNSALSSLDDYDLISRFITLGKTIVFKPVVTAIWRRHPQTLTLEVSDTEAADTMLLIRAWRRWDKPEVTQ
jgi:glycosyltransferase involved in cell wall biosynthesis